MSPAGDLAVVIPARNESDRIGATVRAAARIAGADIIVSFGGGKVIDTGRAAAADLRLPFVCVPTIAASDAPCSALAVIYDEEGRVVRDRFVRRNTVERFGPVREVVHEADQGLVLEVAFDSSHESRRHKSGLAMRFPRISRIRTDKPASEADRVETLRRMVS